MIVDDQILGRDIPNYAREDTIQAIIRDYSTIAKSVIMLKFGEHYAINRGATERCQCKHGQLNGTMTVTLQNRVIFEVKYVDNKRQGKLMEYYLSGKLMRETMHNDGERVDLGITYNPDGTIMGIISYDKPVVLCKYKYGGKIYNMVRFDDQVKSGEVCPSFDGIEMSQLG